MNTGLPGYCNKGIPVPRVLCDSLTEVTEVTGKSMGILQNLQKFRVRVRKYRTHRSSGYCGTGVQNSQKFRAGKKVLYPYPGYLWHERTELTEVPGTERTKFRVRVWMYYRITEVLRRGIPGVNASGIVLDLPYRSQPWKLICWMEHTCDQVW